MSRLLNPAFLGFLLATDLVSFATIFLVIGAVELWFRERKHVCH